MIRLFVKVQFWLSVGGGGRGQEVRCRFRLLVRVAACQVKVAMERTKDRNLPNIQLFFFVSGMIWQHSWQCLNKSLHTPHPCVGVIPNV